MRQPEHIPQGDPCEQCGLGADEHRHRKRVRVDHRDRREYFRSRRMNSQTGEPRKKRERAKSKWTKNSVIGIDGEGYTDKQGQHHYTYLSASSSSELVSEIGDGEHRLSTRSVFDWLLSLPKKPRKVIFSGTYDLTKWCEDLPNDVLFYLWRPDLHPGLHGPKPLEAYVEGKRYSVNLLSTRFSLASDLVKTKKGARWKQRLTMWDIWKFFQCSFVTALDRWDVGTKEERIEIQSMKDKRGNFATIGLDEQLYCQKETRLLAMLAEKLFSACEDAGIKLKSFFGPGSIAAVMLEQNDARDQIVPLEQFSTKQWVQRHELYYGISPMFRLVQRQAARMQLAVECAFFGGRFEINQAGSVETAFSYDLASAYPAAETQLPCLAHGKWKHVRGEKNVLAALDSGLIGCVHWSLPMHTDIKTRERTGEDAFPSDLKTLETVEVHLTNPRVTERAFGPFPFRLGNGAILFPVTAKGGWCWHHEFLAARKYPKVWPNVHCKEAWVFEPKCDCGRPYKKSVARAYLQRLEWGKAGKGLVLKLGINSRYGKRAQSIGAAPFRCLVAAGLITSHTRGAILDAIGRAEDPWNVISISTDGIISTKPIELPSPPETGTEERAKTFGKSALGEWENKALDGGIHVIRPGMRFSLDSNDLQDTTAARGLGVKVLHGHREKVLASFLKKQFQNLAIQQPSAFHGGKLSINVHHEKGCAMMQGRRTGKRTKCSCHPTYHRSPKYGRWLVPDPYRVSYDPLPKRPAMLKNGKMLAWALTLRDGESQPYNHEVSHKHNEDLRRASDEADAQPDGGGSSGAHEGIG
jgi:hypothetical protein